MKYLWIKKKIILGTTLYHYKDAYTVRGILSSFTPSVYAYKEEQTPYVFFPMKDNGNVGHCYIKCYTDKKEEVRQWMNPTFAGSVTGKCWARNNNFLDDIIEQQAMETKFKNITLFFSYCKYKKPKDIILIYYYVKKHAGLIHILNYPLCQGQFKKE